MTTNYEPTYQVGDIYATIESEAFDRAGEPIILIRLVHPPSLVHTHLTSLRPMPSVTYTLSELMQKIHDICGTWGSWALSVHLVGDAPELNNFPQLVNALFSKGHKVLLNSYGCWSLSNSVLERIESLYLIPKPGLIPTPEALHKAKEIRCYINKEGDDFSVLMEWLLAQRDIRHKLFAMPFTLDPDCVKTTIEFCLRNHVRAQIPLCRVMNIDADFMGPNGMEVVNAFHLQDRMQPKDGGGDPYPRESNAVPLNHVMQVTVKEGEIPGHPECTIIDGKHVRVASGATQTCYKYSTEQNTRQS